MKVVLTLSCPNKPGIVHSVTGILFEYGADIVEAAQFDDQTTGQFFARISFEFPQENKDALKRLRTEFKDLSHRFRMSALLCRSDFRIPTLIMVSQLGHCLNDLLFRHQSGLLPIDIRAVVSNHTTFSGMVEQYRLPFHHIPVTSINKADAEAQLIALVQQESVELVVLARYMQILSPQLCERLSGNVINIHHSFLPSFKGARPYQQAHDRGVKVIGATAHYVTAELDEGPIIEQGVERVSHSADVQSLTAIGRDIESVVLARAVRWHAERRVFRCGNKTVVLN